MSFSSLLLAGRGSAMTSYFSLLYLGGFLPLSLLIYSILPQRFRRYFLLAASYSFFWLISGKLVVYLLLSTLSIHYFGLWLDRLQRERDELAKAVPRQERKAVKKEFQRRQRLILLFAAALHIGVLLVLKYSPFFTTNINTLLSHLHIPLQLEVPQLILPIGISFYTLQAVSYLFDVYRGAIQADGNLPRLGLFMSFFPQIVEGPVCRYRETAHQLWEVKGIEFLNLKLGLQRILYGLMKKLVIADRLNPFVKEVFSNYSQYEGGILAIGAVLYTIQLYMDFSGTMDAVVGTAQIFGVKLPENFQRPFFSRSISEFWKRWHITLGAWFKDYIFYPVTMSKCMKSLTSAARKKIGNHFGPLLAGAVALFCVWSCNGLWHGSAWNYIFFGMYHFVLILSGNIIEPAVKRLHAVLHINPESFLYRLFQMVRTSLLVVIGELFFRAEGLRAGFSMFKKILTDFGFTSLNGRLLSKLKMDAHDICITAAALLIILTVSILQEKGIPIRNSLEKRSLPLRWAAIYALILFIVIFGAYGPGYIPLDPIYANF